MFKGFACCSHLEGHGLGEEVVLDALLFFRQLG